MTVQLYVKRLEGEEWRDTVARIASKYSLKDECLHMYDRYIANGYAEDKSAFSALYEWDCLDLRNTLENSDV